jgi:hypothetical protein
MFFNNYFYFFTIVLQAICAIHCIRKGAQNNWIWIIIFLPLIGSVAYIFSEIFTDREIQNVQSGIGTLFNSRGRIKRLENNLRFSDTFNNRIALADAYLADGQTEKAITLYESSLEGNFTENEYVLGQLINAYYQIKRYNDIIPITQKIYKLPQFSLSRQHVLYAIALANTGQPAAAEKEFKMMKARFSNYEARYQYARFMIENNRSEEARLLLKEMIGEVSHLSPRERRHNRHWFTQAKEQLKKLS